MPIAECRGETKAHICPLSTHRSVNLTTGGDDDSQVTMRARRRALFPLTTQVFRSAAALADRIALPVPVAVPVPMKRSGAHQ